MRKFLSLIFISFSIICCKSKEIPKDIIPPNQMQKILYDIHIADAYITTIGDADSAKKVSSAYYKGIYKKFKTDSVRYNKSMDYYYQNPGLLTDMYDRIKADLEKTKQKQDTISVKPVTDI
ncbi:DUF4296 domain-containing protein [Pedobacter quisquiliarum]|nr:DUF4296 domain-containing protein [Pedobacter quisquiliarum]